MLELVTRLHTAVVPHTQVTPIPVRDLRNAVLAVMDNAKRDREVLNWFYISNSKGDTVLEQVYLELSTGNGTEWVRLSLRKDCGSDTLVVETTRGLSSEMLHKLLANEDT